MHYKVDKVLDIPYTYKSRCNLTSVYNSQYSYLRDVNCSERHWWISTMAGRRLLQTEPYSTGYPVYLKFPVDMQ